MIRMRLAAVPVALLAIAACGDADPTAPLLPPGAEKPSAAQAQAPLRDALERIAPTLGPGPAAAALRSALAAAMEDASPTALAAITAALAGLEAEQPDVAVEADVIRLAVEAQR